jgi:hypothetical protein
MSKRPDKVYRIKKISAEYDELYSFLGKSGSSLDTNSLRPKVQNVTQPKNIGNKISTFGIALIAFPDPTISDLVGWALVISGQYMQRKAPIGLKDTYKEFNKINGELKKARFL